MESRVELDRVTAEVNVLRDEIEDVAALAFGAPDGGAPVRRLQELEGAYPFGSRFNFGIKITGAVVTVYASVCYRGGVAISISQDTVTILADGDWVALEVTPGEEPGEDVGAFVRWPSGSVPADAGGKIVRALHRFAFADSKARLEFSAMFGGELGVMAH